MFILRKIIAGQEHNKCLGDSYHLLYKESHKEEFDSFANVVGLDATYYEECYAFVIYNDGSAHSCLFRKQKNYIMTAKGDTFANVSFR